MRRWRRSHVFELTGKHLQLRAPRSAVPWLDNCRPKSFANLPCDDNEPPGVLAVACSDLRHVARLECRRFACGDCLERVCCPS